MVELLLFLFQPMLQNWYNKCHGMCYPIFSRLGPRTIQQCHFSFLSVIDKVNSGVLLRHNIYIYIYNKNYNCLRNINVQIK